MKTETIKKLEELKENVKTMTYYDIYCDMCNICTDYDNEDDSDKKLYLYDKIHEIYEFVSDSDLEEYIIPNELKDGGLQRLRYFLNDCDLSWDIYTIDAYGNLENVTDDMFEDVITQLIDMLKNA